MEIGNGEGLDIEVQKILGLIKVAKTFIVLIRDHFRGMERTIWGFDKKCAIEVFWSYRHFYALGCGCAISRRRSDIFEGQVRIVIFHLVCLH